MKVGYIAKRFVRRQLPDDWAFALLGFLGLGNKTEVEPAEVWAHVKQRLDQVGFDLAGRHLLEVGSGRYARLALHMLHAGVAEVTLVDLFAVSMNDRKCKYLLMDDCSKLELGWDDVAKRVHVLTGDITSLPVPPPEARPEMVISTAVLEHTLDPHRVLVACWKWLKPGGQMSHVIDLRDHIFESPFEMLTFSDRIWQRWLCPKRGFHLNRWRLPDYLEAMQKVGFVDIGYQVLGRDEAALRDILPRLDVRFKDIPLDLLSVLGVHVYGAKSL